MNPPWTRRGPRSRLELAGAATGGETPSMRNYGQFCPIARGSEILAERWTPIILRNLLLGCRTFNEIAAGAPGLSRALLARRLRELERAGVMEIRPKPERARVALRADAGGPGPRRACWGPSRAGPSAGRRSSGEHAAPDVVLWSWSPGVSPPRPAPGPAGGRPLRVRPPAPAGYGSGCWSRGREVEVCRFDPGFGDDLVVTVDDPLTFARWHMGRSGGRRRCGRCGSRSPGPGRCARPSRPGTPGPRRSAGCAPRTACRPRVRAR